MLYCDTVFRPIAATVTVALLALAAIVMVIIAIVPGLMEGQPRC